MTQYLNPRNFYQNQLLALAAQDKRFVAACIQEDCEPCYRGFTAFAAAQEYAYEMESEPGEYRWAVYVLSQDEDGDWSTDYQDPRTGLATR